MRMDRKNLLAQSTDKIDFFPRFSYRISEQKRLAKLEWSSGRLFFLSSRFALIFVSFFCLNWCRCWSKLMYYTIVWCSRRSPLTGNHLGVYTKWIDKWLAQSTFSKPKPTLIDIYKLSALAESVLPLMVLLMVWILPLHHKLQFNLSFSALFFLFGEMLVRFCCFHFSDDLARKAIDNAPPVAFVL